MGEIFRSIVQNLGGWSWPAAMLVALTEVATLVLYRKRRVPNAVT